MVETSFVQLKRENRTFSYNKKRCAKHILRIKNRFKLRFIPTFFKRNFSNNSDLNEYNKTFRKGCPLIKENIEIQIKYTETIKDGIMIFLETNHHHKIV